MGLFRQDPGPCPICGAPHTACTGRPGPVRAQLLPARDTKASEVAPAPLVAEVEAPRLQAEVIQERLPADQFTTGTYRRKKKT